MRVFLSLIIPFVIGALLYGLLFFFFNQKKKNKKDEIYKVQQLVVIISPLFLGAAVYFVYAVYILQNHFEHSLNAYDYVLAMEILRGVMTGIFVLLALVSVIITWRILFADAALKKRWILIGILFFTIAESLTVFETTKLYLDINRQSYIVYEGAIKCKASILGMETITLVDNHGKRLISSLDGPYTGNYRGKVVYGKYSKRAVDLTIN